MKSISRFKITPIRLVNGIIVNEILLKRILTKLKKCQYVKVIYDDLSVRFEYETKTGKGNYELKDIGQYFDNVDIPFSNMIETHDAITRWVYQ